MSPSNLVIFFCVLAIIHLDNRKSRARSARFNGIANTNFEKQKGTVDLTETLGL